MGRSWGAELSHICIAGCRIFHACKVPGQKRIDDRPSQIKRPVIAPLGKMDQCIMIFMYHCILLYILWRSLCIFYHMEWGMLYINFITVGQIGDTISLNVFCRRLSALITDRPKQGESHVLHISDILNKWYFNIYFLSICNKYGKRGVRIKDSSIKLQYLQWITLQ